MLNGKMIQRMLQDNDGRIKNIKLTDKFRNYADESADNGMICDIVGCHYEGNSESWKIKLDFESHMAYNQSIAEYAWYDDNGQPTLNWFQSNAYEKSGNYIWMNKDIDLSEIFEFQLEKEYVFKSSLDGCQIKIKSLNLNDAKVQLADKLIELGYFKLIS